VGLSKIISGGQTGVDRAALDVALDVGIPCGGWCPRGRRAEDGPIPERYPLQETPTEDYPPRTEYNVRASDGTLILTRGEPDRGTALTVKFANRYRKPLFVVDLENPSADEVGKLRRWLESQSIDVLNVAGPRESSCNGVYKQASAFLRELVKPDSTDGTP
jgi:hypothetical protein